MSIVIKLYNVTKRFESVVALDDVSLQLHQNEVFGLLGPNGAGKSTLFDLLVGFRSPTDGSVRVLEMDPQNRPKAIRQRVGILPDAVSVNPNWTGRRHLEFVIEAMDGEETPEAVLERVGLRESIDRPAGKYSKGMQQRLILAMSLVGNPDLLLLDEPSTGVDPFGMKIIRDIIFKEKEKGTSIIFSSHRLEQVKAVADRIGMLANGNVVEKDTFDSIIDDSHSILRVYVDTPPSSLSDIIDIDGVSDAQVTPSGVKVVCTGQAKKSVQDIIEEECGTIRDLEIQNNELENTYLNFIEG